MSKNVKILQDGQEKTLNKVSKIQTQLANGLTCNWIPEDEVPLGELTVASDGVYNPAQDPNGPYYGYSKVTVSGVGTTVMGQLAEITITKNGTYTASADNDGPFYGYSKVIVNVKSSDDGGGGSSSRPVVPGKDSDGDDAVVTTDDDGNIVTEKLPVEIRVITTPDNLEYEDGQSIVFDGLLVKAYYPDGTEYDSIPTTDLIMPVRVAVAEGISPFSSFTKTLDGKSVQVTSSMKTTQYYRTVDPSRLSRSVVASCGDGCIIYRDGWSYYAVSYSNDSTVNWQNSEDGLYVYRESERGLSGTVITSKVLGNGQITNREIYYCYIPGSDYTNDGYEWFAFREPDLEASGYGSTIAADIALSGIGEEAGSQQTIPLQWERPGDKKVLEASFTITVHASDDSGDSGGSGGGSDPQPQPTPPPG